jgi:hypothetical protein
VNLEQLEEALCSKGVVNKLVWLKVCFEKEKKKKGSHRSKDAAVGGKFKSSLSVF